MKAPQDMSVGELITEICTLRYGNVKLKKDVLEAWRKSAYNERCRLKSIYGYKLKKAGIMF